MYIHLNLFRLNLFSFRKKKEFLLFCFSKEIIKIVLPGINETRVIIVLTNFSIGDNKTKTYLKKNKKMLNYKYKKLEKEQTFFCNKINLKRINVLRR